MKILNLTLPLLVIVVSALLVPNFTVQAQKQLQVSKQVKQEKPEPKKEPTRGGDRRQMSKKLDTVI
jgi:hypothetical protein